MRKLLIFWILLLIVVCSFFVAGYYVMFDYDFTDTYTRAVCSDNLCQDYSFTCSGGKIVESKAISGYVAFDEKWVDLRETDKNC